MYLTNLDKKIATNAPAELIQTVCVWSDLLGFSNPFISSNWNLDAEQWRSVAKRLTDMQNICTKNFNPFLEEGLVSNDAIIRNLDVSKVNDLTQISMWIKSVYYYFSGVNSNEKEHGFAGMRLVISAGHRLIHNMDSVSLDDYVYNYTKPNPEEMSNLCKANGDRTVIYNHKFMQMNTAFSKSYIIDTIGSGGGVSGNSFYIDVSFIEFLKNFAKKMG